MEMYYLVMKLGYASIVIPEKYLKDQCYKVAGEINKTDFGGYCIPAPNNSNVEGYCKYHLESISNGPYGQIIKKCDN